MRPIAVPLDLEIPKSLAKDVALTTANKSQRIVPSTAPHHPDSAHASIRLGSMRSSVWTMINPSARPTMKTITPNPLPNGQENSYLTTR